MTKFYLVTGRMIGDDEDTTLTPIASSGAEAVAAYIEEMWALECSSYTEADQMDRAMRQANGEGVVINGVYESLSPITEVE